MSNSSFIITIIISLLFTACQNRKCNNNNPLFDKYTSQSEQYKNELAEVITTYDDLKYYLDSYDEINGNNYLNVSVQSNKVCAKAAIWIRNKDSKLDGIIKNKGNGYSGAELKSLQIGIAPHTKKIQFVYNGLDKVID